MDFKSKSRLEFAFNIAALAAIYFVLAKFGLSLRPVYVFAAPLWPSSGIALVALFLWGSRLWPGVALGAFLVNWQTGAAPLIAILIALGNTLGSWVGVFFLRKFEFEPAFNKSRSVVTFVLFAAGISALISPTVGVASLYLSGSVPRQAIYEIWQTWWFGDFFGNLIFGSFLFVWSTQQIKHLSWKKILEFALLIFSVSLVAITTFSNWIDLPLQLQPQAYFIFPIFLMIAFRYGPLGVVNSLIVTTTTIFTAILFSHQDLWVGSTNDIILRAQIFLGILGVTKLIFAANILEKKEQRIAIKESLADRQATLDSALDAIVTIDHTGHIEEFNPAAERTFGWRKGEVIGKELCSLIIPLHFRAAHLKGIQNYFKTGVGPFLGKRIELPALRSDQSEFLTEMSILRLKTPGPAKFTAFIRDITIQKNAELERLQFIEREKSSQKINRLQYRVVSLLALAKTVEEAGRLILKEVVKDLNYTLGALWIFEPNTNSLVPIEFWTSENKLLAPFIRDSKKMSVTDGIGFPVKILKSVRTEAGEIRSEMWSDPRLYVAKKCELAAVVGFPILSGERVLGVIELYSVKKLKFEVDSLNMLATFGKQFGQVLDRLTSEEALRNAIQMRDEFMSIASHELRTPLTGLKLQLHIVKLSTDAGTNSAAASKKVSRSLEISSKQVDRLSGLIDELLDVTRVQGGRLDFNFEELDLSQFIIELCERYFEPFAANHSKLSWNIEKDIVAWVDPSRFEQVITNLFSNAIKYAPGCDVEVNLFMKPEGICLEVRDRGPGIPLELQDRIFDRFSRATTSVAVGGLGLGLYIAKQIVVAHQGKIHVENIKGAGACFSILLSSRARVEKEDLQETNYV